MVNLHVSLTTVEHESRLLKETSSLVKCGIATRVLIAGLHESGLAENEAIDSFRSIWRIPLRSRALPRNLLTRMITYLEFLWKVFRYAHTNRVEMVNVHSLSLLPIGVFLKWTLGAKLIYDAHELETERQGLSGFPRAVARFLERILIGQAVMTIVVSRAIEQHYRKEYPNHPMVTVMNCPITKDVEKSQMLREEFQIPESATIFIYVGGFSSGRGIDIMLDAFEHANPTERAIVFMGYGPLEDLIKTKAANSSAIFFKDAVPPGQVLGCTASADVGIALIEDVSMSYRYSLPNKLFEYLAAGLPVIVSDLPEMARVVRESKAGIILSDVTTKGLTEGIERLSASDYETLAANAKEASRVYSWQNQEQVLINAYRKHVLRRAVTP